MVAKLLIVVAALSILWPTCNLPRIQSNLAPPQPRPQVDDTGPARIEYNGAILVCDEPVHDFGTRWVGPPLNHEFAIRNEGEALGWIRISFSGGPAGGCLTNIEFGETIYIVVSMRSNKLRGKFEKSITVKLLPASPERNEQPWCIRRPFENACEAAP